MAEARQFLTLEVATALTGIGLCETSFSRIHELLTFVSGFDIYNHEIAHDATMRRIGDHVRAKLPLLPTREAARADFRAAAASALAAYGETVTIEKGTLTREVSPGASLQHMMAGRG